jgi:hypothetical protein
MFGRGICGKYQSWDYIFLAIRLGKFFVSRLVFFANTPPKENTSLETKFPSPFGSENFSSLDWYFSQIPLPNMIHLYKTLTGQLDLQINNKLHEIHSLVWKALCSYDANDLDPMSCSLFLRSKYQGAGGLD